ncbi:MAG: DUF5658 family protein, partial [Polyangiales bacterium]
AGRVLALDDSMMSSTVASCPRLSTALPAAPRALPWLQKSSWLEALLAATLVFNFLDTVLTIALVSLDLAVEANPLMASLLDFSPVCFALTKIALVSSGVMILWRFREQALAAVGTAVVFSVYGGLMLYHLQSVSVLAQFAA